MPVEAAVAPLSEEIDSTLLKETVMVSPDKVPCKADTTGFYQESLQYPVLLASRPKTRLKSQQILKSVVDSLIYTEVWYTPKELQSTLE